MNYINTNRVNNCMFCEYYRSFPKQGEPCFSCKHRVKPKYPAKELNIHGTKYQIKE